MFDFIRQMLVTPEAQPDAYTWGAALLGHFAIGVFLTGTVAAGSYAIKALLRRVLKFQMAHLAAAPSAAVAAAAYLLLWEGCQLAFHGATLADSLVDAAAVACGAAVAAGAWHNRGAVVAIAFAILAIIGVRGIKTRK